MGNPGQRQLVQAKPLIIVCRIWESGYKYGQYTYVKQTLFLSHMTPQL